MNIFWYMAIAIPLVAIAVLLITYRSWYHTAAAQPVKNNNHTILPAVVATWPLTTLTVGVLTPIANEAALSLIEGLTDLLSISTKTHYSIVPLTGDNTRVTLFERAQQAGSSCDVLVTFGVTCANIATEAAEFLPNIPIIKVGLRDDQTTRLLPHAQHTVIITTEYDYEQQIAIFKEIKPSAKEICILYRLNHEHIREEVIALNKALLRAGFKTHTHILAHNAHIDNQLSAFSTSYDTLFVMPYTVTATNAQELITFCITKKITLCAQEFDIVTLGAAVGFGKSEKELGSHVGHLIRNIFEGKKKYPPDTIMTHYPIYQCMINKKKCAIQGVDLSPEYITLLEHARIVNHYQKTPHIAERHDQF